MSFLLWAVLLLVWWTIAIAFSAITLAAAVGMDRPGKGALVAIAASIFWPVSAVVGAVIFVYRCVFRSARTIRVDLKNRNLLREFDQWIVARRAEEKAAMPRGDAET